MLWIESSGGPLVLIEKQLLNEWGGIDKSSDVNYNSDYDRACDIDDYAEKLSIPSREVVIFGEKPNRTSFVRLSDKESIIVRWRWAPDENVVDKHLQKLNEAHFKDAEQLQIQFKNNEVMIFDSSCNGLESMEALNVDLVPGNYVLETAVFEPDNETCLLLHKLQCS